MRALVLRNQMTVGSVNASQRHFARGISDLERANAEWPGVVQNMITHRLSYTEFDRALRQHPQDEIKTVLDWSPQA